MRTISTAKMTKNKSLVNNCIKYLFTYMHKYIHTYKYILRICGAQNKV